MLNPSTADAEKNDPTVTRCINYAKTWGFEALDVCNLFAWRSTDPKVLRALPDPVGADNDATIAAAARDAKLVIVAWGANVTAQKLEARARTVLSMLAPHRPHALALTKDGQPSHPLMLRASLQPFPVEVTP
jgi:hypothetical protein